MYYIVKQDNKYHAVFDSTKDGYGMFETEVEAEVVVTRLNSELFTSIKSGDLAPRKDLPSQDELTKKNKATLRSYRIKS